ncbi:hypothetical protein GCM10010169_33880 [Micromonospora fulviviridis]|nr:hypothetical protein GCM10010169_33880 [Micromonospora fulviviridis]
MRGAYIIRLDRLWSQEELSHAASYAEKDPRIALALKHAKTFGVAESLAAGPELLSDWRNAWAPGSHARGAALVAAAVDCRRAGLSDPVPHDLLLELHHHYLAARGGPALRPESVDEAWAWALRPVHGASSLLIPAGLCDAGSTYVAFDYLIDRPEHEPIPTETWNILLTRTNSSQAWQVAYEAYWRARTAFYAAVESGTVDDVGSRATAMADRGDYAMAIRLLKDEFDKSATHNSAADNRWLQHQLAVNLMLSGRVDEAETIFESLLQEAERTLPPDDEYLQVVRHNIASCMGRRGDLPGALACFRRILADRERYLGPEAMNTLATRGAIAGIIAKMGEPSEALRQTQNILADEVRALGKDHTNTFETRRSLARYFALTGDFNSAIDALQALLPDLERALGADHLEILDARWDLARYHRQKGNRPQAKRLFEEALAHRERVHGTDNEGTRQARHEYAKFLAQPD